MMWCGRTPRGVRGLKLVESISTDRRKRSHPSRGACGYVFAQTTEGNPLTSAGQIEKENPFFITFSDGQAEVMPVSVKKNKK